MHTKCEIIFGALSTCFFLNISIAILNIRHDQYWQIAYPIFLIAQNCIIIYLRKLSRFWGKFSSTALVIDTSYVKYCSVLTTNAVLENLPKNHDNFLKQKIYISRSFFMQFYATKKRPKSIISNAQCTILCK